MMRSRSHGGVPFGDLPTPHHRKYPDPIFFLYKELMSSALIRAKTPSWTLGNQDFFFSPQDLTTFLSPALG